VRSLPCAQPALRARGDDKRVTFAGPESQAWAHLIGQPTPATPWGRQGDAWPVRYIDTSVVAGGDVPVHDAPEGRRAVVDGFTFTVDADLNATVIAPAGRTVTVRTA
jgi:hypothetical protein